MRPRSPLLVSPQTDFEQLSAGVQVYALILHDLHRIYLLERRRIEDAQDGVDEGERLQRTDIDAMAILAPIAEAIETADRRISEYSSVELL